MHAAARVMDEAVGGQILTSDEVRKHAEPQVDWSFLDLGLFWLRGFPERWRLYEVSWNDTSAGAAARCCAGTTHAVRGARSRAGQPAPACQTMRWPGTARLALVAGEPGVGKSRLVAEIGDVGPSAWDAGAHRALRGDERCARRTCHMSR